jgi:hypothetical protein
MNQPDPAIEENRSLWLLVVSPSIWAVHFLACYITAAVWCEKLAGADHSLGPVRTAIWIYTILAAGAIAFTGWTGYKRHTLGDGRPPHDEDTPEDRHRFLGFATFLLSSLSLVATIFEALVLAYFWNCH